MPGMEIKGRRYSVLGAARSGRAVAALLKRHGAEVLVSDLAPLEQMKEARRELEDLGIASEFGAHSDRVLDADVVVVSPGVPSNAPPVQAALRRKMEVVSELEVGSWFCGSPIIAITGTNGKTTTATLTGAILEQAGRPVAVAGNIGTAFSQVVETLTPETTVVLEVSSFQLDFCRTFRPRVAVLLNITPDHLDRYEHSFEKYSDAKARVFSRQGKGDVIVFNADDPETVRQTEAKAPEGVALVPFSVGGTPVNGAFVDKGQMIAIVGNVRHKIIAVSAIGIPGQHNLSNSMAASLAALAMHVPPSVIAETLSTFRGVEHRLEFVRDLNGVRYVNDSKGTNVDSVWYALQSFESPIVLILGGRDKGNDYSRLMELVRKNVRAIVAIGESADKVVKAFRDVRPVVTASTMEEAVRLATTQSLRGDVVLLSPACASFDWFENYEHRGRIFKEVVRGL
jgi:UDP-N-acetylmuramoylalanine--D-glutamate ligase